MDLPENSKKGTSIFHRSINLPVKHKLYFTIKKGKIQSTGIQIISTLKNLRDLSVQEVSSFLV